MANILDQIVSKRRQDIAELGVTLGSGIPSSRQRAVRPFLSDKSVILEVKRASPSKGDIAPDLDAAGTALEYEAAGARAISVLTERHWFKGSLEDLVSVASVTKVAAVLRKDFLVDVREVEVSYLCGADAVLLIARILDDDTLVAMARECARLGMTAFVELRVQEDFAKLRRILDEVGDEFVAAGVNARDLRDFRIDLLIPAGALAAIKQIAGEGARVVFESGIRSPHASRFAASMGFSGLLLGEAAAKNPRAAGGLVDGFLSTPHTPAGDKWLCVAQKLHCRRLTGNAAPLVKICGITNAQDALEAVTLGADFVGFVFCSSSPRCTNAQSVRSILSLLREKGRDGVFTCAVITDLKSEPSKEAIDLVKRGEVDFLQLHGFSSEDTNAFFADGSLCALPHYFAVNVSTDADLALVDYLLQQGEPRILVDSRTAGKVGGTGKRVDADLVHKVASRVPLWLAGGIDPDNVCDVVCQLTPEIIDVSSGVEEQAGHKSHAKMKALFENLIPSATGDSGGKV